MTLFTARGSASRRAVLRGCAALAAFACVPVPGEAAAGPMDLPKPGPRDTCPVCGMFVAPYPAWVATIVYRDGALAHFDGAKDMFKYIHDLPKYAPGRKPDDIARIGVTDYYETQMIDARAALFVIGSDVLGPMGHELVPHASEDDAREFSKDHKGRRTLRFDDASAGLMRDLDDGKLS